jgi:GT2 family glycosyltransferase
VRVLAIVLTHDAPESLERCLAALAAQTRRPDRILVVDNASRIPAVSADRTVPTEIVHRSDNDGPAGGHAAGLERFLQSGEDAAWVMDDDCIPAPGCLEALVGGREVSAPRSLVFPLWVDGPTGAARFLPAWCGFLIGREVVERVGLPRADFVWWAEDTEYLQWRMLEAGVRTEHEAGAVVEHHRVRSTGPKPAWKIYYEVRNTIVYRVFVQRWTLTHLRLLFRSLVGLLVQACRASGRRASLRAYACGVRDGCRQRLGLRMTLGSGPQG